MKIRFTSEFSEKLRGLNEKQKKTGDKLRQQLKIFKADPWYPSLRNHKLKGILDNVWSISFGNNFRALYFIDGDTAVFYNLGTHDEVYRK